MTDAPVLEIRNLRTSFFTRAGEVKAVNDVSLSVPAGKTLGVLGESGSGKSVTALSVLRLIPFPQGRILGGEILLDGEDLLKLKDRALRRVRGKEVSMIFQEPMMSLNPVYTVGNQLMEVFVTHQGLSRPDAYTESVRLLDVVRIPEAAQRMEDYPHNLSGGMRQRVMIAMALACRPKLLIADEPTTALDVTIQAQILELLQELQREFGMAIMLITHDIGVVAEMADRVAVMYAGRVMEEMDIDALFDCPAHPYTHGLLRSVPKKGRKFAEGKTPLHEIPGTVPSLASLPPGCAFAARCPKAHARCAEDPPFVDLGDGHRSRCWLGADAAAATA